MMPCFVMSISARITGGTVGFPHCGCRPHVLIHGVEVSALLAPHCRPPLFFLSSTTDVHCPLPVQGHVYTNAALYS